MAKTTEPEKAPEGQKPEMAKILAPQPPQPTVHEQVAPTKREKPTSNTTVMRPDIANTGLAGADPDGRLVRVLKKSYLNGAEFDEGAITHWPAGVEKLGANLVEYKGE